VRGLESKGAKGAKGAKGDGDLGRDVDRHREFVHAISLLAEERAETGWRPRIRSTRRAFVAFVGALFLTPSLAFAQRTDTGLRADEVLRTLCDHFIPASGKNPGALALGVDSTLLELFAQAPQGSLALQQLASGLGGASFLELPSELQEARLRGALEAGPMSGQLNLILAFCTQNYYANPSAWVPLGYRTPQPNGYPDYASRCRPANPVDGVDAKAEPTGEGAHAE
jgi:hypothetical protein